MTLTCSDFTYLEYARVAVEAYHKVPQLSGLSQEEQEETKRKLVAEFQELTGDRSFSNYKKLYEDLNRFADLHNKYAVLYNTMVHSGETSDTLYEVLDEFKIKNTREESFDKLLAKVFARMKKAELQYKSIEKQLERLRDSNKGSSEVTEAALLKIVAVVSTGLKFSISVNDNAVVVAEYINILNKQQESHGK